MVIRLRIWSARKDPLTIAIPPAAIITHVDDGIGPAVSVGMDVLRHLRVYIAYDEGKLYI